jgi:hypothetical protein
LDFQLPQTMKERVAEAADENPRWATRRDMEYAYNDAENVQDG